MASHNRPYTFDRVIRIVFSITCVIISVWLIDYLKMVLLPFLVAWLIAYMLEPFVQYNRAMLQTRGRFWAVFMTLFEAMLMLLLLTVLFMPSIISEFHQIGRVIEKYAVSGAAIPFIPEEVHDFIRKAIDFNSIADIFKKQGVENIMDWLPGMLSGSIGVVMWIINWFFTILYVIFIMLDYDKLLNGFKRMVPPKYRKRTFSVGRNVKDSMNHYFRGQALVALCVGIMFSIGFSLIGLPLAVVMGIFIGVLNMVPYLQFISIIPITLLCMICSVENTESFWPMWWSCIAIYAIVQCIQDLILTPKIMGKMMGLNPAIILLSLSLWGTLLGFIGLIIALPLTTLLLSYYNQYISNREDGETPASRAADAEALSDMSTYPDD